MRVMVLSKIVENNVLSFFCVNFAAVFLLYVDYVDGEIL